MPAPDDANAAILASLRFRRIRTFVLFYAFILLMPLGCACPCALAVAIDHNTTRTVLGVTAFLLPFVGLGGMLLMMTDINRYGRMLAVARKVDALGFVYTDWPREPKYAFMRGLRLFSHANVHVATNLFEGAYGDYEVTGMDYSYTLGFGRYQIAHDQTVVVLHDAVRGIPNFVLSPRGLVDKVLPWLGERGIELAGEKAFNKQFVLGGGLRGGEVADYFTPEVIDLCLADPDLTAEVNDGTLIVYRRGKVLPAGGIEPLLREAVALAEALRGEGA
jgi:hypothetical protein